MLANLVSKLLAPFFHGLLAWGPWLWLIICALVAVGLFFTAPLALKKWWQTIAVTAVVGFIGLWVWQHFDRFTQLEKKNTELTQKLDAANQQINSLNQTVSNNADNVATLERQQRQIQADLKKARKGLDSATVSKEAQDDPIKASANLSSRWNNLNGMFDEATGSFGTAAATRSSPNADSDATR